MGRSPCCEKNGLKKGPWTEDEDEKLVRYIRQHGPGNWRTLPKNAGLERCGKSCRLRWTNYLRPDIKRGRFTFEEEETIIQLHRVLGNKWSAIASRLPGRTDNEIKNYWNTHIRKRLMKMGIDPVTHAPRLDFFDLSSLLVAPQFDLSNLLHLQTLLNSNPQMLKLALTLLQSTNENPYVLLKKLQENQLSLAESHIQVPQLHPNQIENVPFDSFQGVPMDSMPQMFHDIPSFERGVPDQSNSSFNSGSSNDNSMKMSFESVFSTPVSSSQEPWNPSTAVMDGGATEERDNFFLLTEGFDLDEFV